MPARQSPWAAGARPRTSDTWSPISLVRRGTGSPERSWSSTAEPGSGNDNVMFLGHYGVALALKRAEPKLSLGTLFLAVQLADVLWGVFLLLGWEHVRVVPGFTAATPLDFYDYPISHS